MRFIEILLIAVMMLLGVTAFADVATTTQSFVDKIPSPDGQLVLVGAALVEMILRLVKTQKPVSILHAVSRTVRAVAEGLVKVCDLIDKILPERVEGQSLVGKKPEV